MWRRRRSAASRDAALETAENVIRDGGAEQAADLLHSVRTATGVLDSGELPIDDFDELNVAEAVTAIKGLTDPADVRAILAYEESNKGRQGVISAAQTRVAHIAQEVCRYQLTVFPTHTDDYPAAPMGRGVFAARPTCAYSRREIDPRGASTG